MTISSTTGVTLNKYTVKHIVFMNMLSLLSLNNNLKNKHQHDDSQLVLYFKDKLNTNNAIYVMFNENTFKQGNTIFIRIN